MVAAWISAWVGGVAIGLAIGMGIPRHNYRPAMEECFAREQRCYTLANTALADANGVIKELGLLCDDPERYHAQICK
jgi:hypothetical protein